MQFVGLDEKLIIENIVLPFECIVPLTITKIAIIVRSLVLGKKRGRPRGLYIFARPNIYSPTIFVQFVGLHC